MPPTSSKPSLFGSSGIRGRVNELITGSLAIQVGLATANYLRNQRKEPCIMVGHDHRTTGPMLTSAVMAGLLQGGVRVYKAGMAPTPTIVISNRPRLRARCTRPLSVACWVIGLIHGAAPNPDAHVSLAAVTGHHRTRGCFRIHLRPRVRGLSLLAPAGDRMATLPPEDSGLKVRPGLRN